MGNIELRKRNKALLKLYSEMTAKYLLAELEELDFPYDLTFELVKDNWSDVRDYNLLSAVHVTDNTNNVDFTIGINHTAPFKLDKLATISDDELVQACIYVNEMYSGNYTKREYLSKEENRQKEEELQNVPYTYLKRHFQYKWAYSYNIIGDNCYLFCKCAHITQFQELAKLLALRVLEIMLDYEKAKEEDRIQLQRDLLFRVAVKTGDVSILLNSYK